MSDILALKFNARALSEGSSIQMVHSRYGWHLQTCFPVYDCICPDLLNDPGRIFDNTPSNVPMEESIKHFRFLAKKNHRDFIMRDNGHLCNCIYTKGAERLRGDQQYECACFMLRKNPEQFFKIPLKDRQKILTTEIKDLRNEWFKLDEECKTKKFNILCRVLGKTFEFISTESAGYHLNTCPFSYSNTGPDTCGCSIPINYPAKYFIQWMNEKCKIRGEEKLHSKDCARVQLLFKPYDTFPEYFNCTC